MQYCEERHIEVDVELSERDAYCDACIAKEDAKWEAKRLADYEKRKRQGEPRRIAYAAGSLPRAFGMLIRCEIADRDGTDCGICGEPLDPLKAHVDHIIPIARGGLHEWENVRLTHPFCNMSKGAR